MRTFVRLRQMLASNAELSRKLADMEKKYDHQFKIVFDAIRQLMTPDEPKNKPIGFKRVPEIMKEASLMLKGYNSDTQVDRLMVDRPKADREKLFTSAFSLQPKYLPDIFASALLYTQSFERNVDNGGQ